MNRRARQNKSSGRQPLPIDTMMIASNRGSPAAQTDFPKEDYFRRQQSWLLSQTPPKSISNQIHWVKATKQALLTISATVPTESNFAFVLSDFTDTSGLANFFDQYCVYEGVVNISFQYNGTTPWGLGSVVTAIDYDNTGALGSLAAIQAFESAMTTKITFDQSIQRLVKPAVSPALYSGSAFTAFGITRAWVDSASTGVPHYGFRSFYVSNVGTTLTAIYDISCVFGFRNNL